MHGLNPHQTLAEMLVLAWTLLPIPALTPCTSVCTRGDLVGAIALYCTFVCTQGDLVSAIALYCNTASWIGESYKHQTQWYIGLAHCLAQTQVCR